MKKILVILLVFFFISDFTSACKRNTSPKANLIQSKRRFAEYIESQAKNDTKVIDLSEGPKLKYDKTLGPQNLNFDIKIVDPY